MLGGTSDVPLGGMDGWVGKEAGRRKKQTRSINHEIGEDQSGTRRDSLASCELLLAAVKWRAACHEGVTGVSAGTSGKDEEV